MLKLAIQLLFVLFLQTRNGAGCCRAPISLFVAAPGPIPVALGSAPQARPFQAWQEWRDSNPQPPVLETGALAN